MKLREVTGATVTEATATMAAPAAQAAGKSVGRYLIPGVGSALGAQDAYSRYKKGDYAGAAISGVGAAASLIPGVGGLVGGLGAAGFNAMRDKARTGSYFPDEEEQAAAVAKDKQAPQAQAAPAAQVPAGGNPKVFALQQQLKAKGAKITADGKMGPQTQAAMKQFPDVKLAESIKENKMTEAERIAALRERLSQLESQPQVADEGIGDVFKGIGKGFQKFKTGVSNPRSTNLPSGKNLPQQTGAAIARNPGKVAAGSAAAGALGAAAMMGGAGTKPAEPAKPVAPVKPATGSGTKPAAATAPAAAAGLTPQEEQELALLAADMAKLKGQNSELDDLIDRHLKLRPDAGQIATPQ